MTPTQIAQLIASGESDRVERTVSVRNIDKFSEAVCVFANDLPGHKQSGYLLIGVEDNGGLSGLKVTDALLKNLGSLRPEGNILPPPVIHVQKFSYPEGDVAVVEVQPSFFPPVRYKDKVWIRIGPRKAVANEAEERLLIVRRQAGVASYDSCPFPGTSLDSLRSDVFKHQYLPKAIAEDVLEKDKRGVTEQLASLRLFDTKNNAPTVVGLLLLGKEPTYLLSGAYLQYVRFSGIDKAGEVMTEIKFSGDLVAVLKRLDTFIDTALVNRKPVPVSVLREERVVNYPYWALRELVMNAVLHRDYQSNIPIRLYQFDDRIEIMNAGGLYGNACPETFPDVNDYRNPVIAEAMKVLGYVNRFSRGVSRVNDELRENGNGLARFSFELLTVFEVTVHLSSAYYTPVTPQVEEVTKILHGKESLAREELQQIMKIKDRKYFARAYLKPSLEAGWIEMTIPGKPNSGLQHYRLSARGMVMLQQWEK